LELAQLYNLYAGLAEVLSASQAKEIPSWFLLEGLDWPFAISNDHQDSWIANPVARLAQEAMDAVPRVSRPTRWQEYKDLFFASEGPSVWLYESYYLDGRVAGPSTFALKKIYAQASLAPTGAELADHAAGELSFLAFLTVQERNNPNEAQVWKSARRLFVQNHAQRWLPVVGQQLIQSEYPSWKAIGHLLIASLNPAKREIKIPDDGKVPSLISTSACSLCGFCSQLCPTQALSMAENTSSTSLKLIKELCIQCNKCEQICPEDIIAMVAGSSVQSHTLLRSSPRVKCPKCGKAHVSEAEMESVANKIGNSDYLSYCIDCRGM